ncbi:adenylate kinase family enzyme [Rhodobacter aestuarii]|uniref:Adenylate kinase n=1 Tax=Rhodobacter aestuarii TaxID=453582 RepID=A0A1N7NWP3_9RHOB|nr:MULTISPECIES: shikimate kinase [Rhodobacter]PTV94497.1 adenylate kinase family enzyme [Rhodobacter aestuarii]SIT02805.1 Adenylate kinase [Rhodobacter aestuarii]SOC12212.1 adenylate kinase family enzyme [Rhodobacter sp. JA431]
MAARVYITGAAGAGTSTLGRALADQLGVPFLDTDDFYWTPTEPPFTTKRPVAERLALIAAAQLGQGEDGGWVLAGSCDGWGDVAIDGADLIVYISTPAPLRLSRIRKREAARWGDRIQPGGDMERQHAQFIKWAAGYEDPYFSGRSLARHLAWLVGRNEPVIEVSGTTALGDLVASVTAKLTEITQQR